MPDMIYKVACVATLFFMLCDMISSTTNKATDKTIGRYMHIGLNVCMLHIKNIRRMKMEVIIMKNLTELVFILDRSGSMSGLEADTIGGFNSMIEKQKKEAGEALVSVVLFDDQTEVIYDRADIRQIQPMTDEQYFVRGCTALLDAIGGAISHIKDVRKRMPESERPEKTIFIITTDGMENASHRYNYAKIKKMIEKRQAKNWEFIFLGANIDAVAEAGRMGIRAGRAVNYHCDAAGTALNYKVLSQTVAMMRSCESAQDMTDFLDEEDCFEEIEEDYARRK